MLTGFISAAFAIALATAPLPKVDGRRIQAATTCYAIEREGAQIGETLQSIHPTRADGVRAWRIIVHQRVAGGRFELRDEFMVQRKNLRPISLHSRRGTRSVGTSWHDARLAYGTSRITGTRETSAGVQKIDVPLDGPVWEGNLWGVTFASLPLREGGRFQLPFWQYDKGFGAFIVNVTGSEVVATPGGKVDAWVLEAGDDPNKLVRYLIAKRTGAELGYGAPGMRQAIGGDCRGMG